MSGAHNSSYPANALRGVEKVRNLKEKSTKAQSEFCAEMRIKAVKWFRHLILLIFVL